MCMKIISSDIKKRYSMSGWGKKDYIDFCLSVGVAFFATTASIFLLVFSKLKSIDLPDIVYSIPIGFLLFSVAWIFDSIAHRTIYRNKIDSYELKLHNFMVYGSGIPLVVCFIFAYFNKECLLPFIVTFLFLKTMYSIYDEFGFHWPRFKEGRSDIVEVTAHYFQFLGNILFDVAWFYWIYFQNYRGADKLILSLFEWI